MYSSIITIAKTWRKCCHITYLFKFLKLLNAITKGKNERPGSLV